ncbi:hypothetical protein [Parasphingorhabdus halotolerans]|uniref:RiboL-PSP-HEPN domain-containing protein n=1 Tax=Parasphingorhabdus halotolerans TaxID=2725558 RepID=A0A6H2DIJ4_9SPHN|nr:hypothetical protein [Parasphingorhabdus halotolerans]QJB68210.1 hypothetical protein HF685_01920 [Parasphingorhabdus halotolerans]
MSISLDRTRFVTEEITGFLAVQAEQNRNIESYFTQHLLVVFYSETEQKIKKLVEHRLNQIDDRKVAKFIYSTNEGMLNRIKKGELNDLLKKFDCGDGDIIGDEFSQAEHQKYSGAIANRHSVSHGEGASMTLEEFLEVLNATEKILTFVEEKISE